MSFTQNPNASFNFLNGALTLPSAEQLLSFREALLEGLPVPLLVLDEQDRVLYANRAFAIFWSMLWALIIFGERVTLKNIIGVAVIFAGIMLVNQDAG